MTVRAKPWLITLLVALAVLGVSAEFVVDTVLRFFSPSPEPWVLLPGAGIVLISWPQAVVLLEQCLVNSVVQTHALDVYFELKDGERIRAVEPAIDEVFAVVERTRNQCGTISIATE